MTFKRLLRVSSFRNETGWDLGPFAAVAAVLAPGQTFSSSNKMQRNYKGLKITVYMCHWGKNMKNKQTKNNTPTAISEESRAKAG